MSLTIKRSLWMAAGVLGVIGAIAAWKIITVRAIIAKMSAQKPPPTVVSSVKAPEEIWQRRLHAVGSFAPVDGVLIAVAGGELENRKIHDRSTGECRHSISSL